MTPTEQRRNLVGEFSGLVVGEGNLGFSTGNSLAPLLAVQQIWNSVMVRGLPLDRETFLNTLPNDSSFASRHCTAS